MTVAGEDAEAEEAAAEDTEDLAVEVEGTEREEAADGRVHCLQQIFGFLT